MRGSRKIVLTAIGVVAILLLALMVARAGLAAESGVDLAWVISFLVASAMGGNALEHWAQRPARAVQPGQSSQASDGRRGPDEMLRA